MSQLQERIAQFRKMANDDPDNEAITIVMKAKPLFLFMHMLFQRVVDYPPKVGNEKQMAYVPPADL